MARTKPRGRPTGIAAGTVESEEQLRRMIAHLDGEPFPRYRQLVGGYRLGSFGLTVDRVPPDPFAGPARLRLSVERSESGLEQHLVDSVRRRVAIEDWLARRAEEALQRTATGPAGHTTGAIRLQEIGAAVLERSACRVTDDRIELRLLVDLPAAGRRIRGRQAAELFFVVLPRLATASLLFAHRTLDEARRAAENVEDHCAIQRLLVARGLVAFLAEGSRLARAGGSGTAADLPRSDGQQVPLEVDESLRVRLALPHAGEVVGLGIPAGVTLIVGGGFHGKSTLLEAIARGGHPHRLGDGRERVATIAEAVTIRAEDGRSVRGVDISGFLGALPSGVRSQEFTTDRASGSTSQAAAIVEALEVGARLLLLDEDRCATNFMVRDGRMQRLVPRRSEPIVPFLDRVRELYDRFKVSTILVTGGSGDYLEVADTVIQMDGYRARDATDRARDVAARTRTMRLQEEREPMSKPPDRLPDAGGNRLSGLRFGLRGPRGIRAGDETLDLQALSQIVETGQVRTVAAGLRRIARRLRPGVSLRRLVEQVDADLDANGLDGFDSPVAYELSRPRSFELAAALNRWRALRFTRTPRGSS